MKNNRITFNQFCLLSTIPVFISLLFIDSSGSVFQPIACIGALLANNAVIYLYKGAVFVKPIAALYLYASAAVSSFVFVRYICDGLGYGPCALIALILFGFSFFCTVKGIEAAARASLIVGAVVLMSVIYIVVSTASGVDYRFNFEPKFSAATVFISLFPSAAYIMLYENIIPRRKYNCLFYFSFAAAVYTYFTLASSGVEKEFPVIYLPSVSKIDIFKGSDGLLLTALSLSSLFINSVSTLAVLKNRKHNYISNCIYLVSLTVVTVVMLCVYA